MRGSGEVDWERTRVGGLGKGSAASPPASLTAVYRGMHLLVFWSSLGWMLLGELESTFFRPPAPATHPSRLGPGEKRGRLSS